MIDFTSRKRKAQLIGQQTISIVEGAFENDLNQVGQHKKQKTFDSFDTVQLNDDDSYFVLPSREQAPDCYESFIALSLRQIQSETAGDLKSLLQQKRFKTRLELSTDRLREANNTDGDAKLAKVKWYLNNMNLTRSMDQRLFHTMFIHASLQKIYGREDWYLNSQRVLDSEKITALRQEVLIMTPRRLGKTYAAAMFILAMMLGVPGIRIAIFSTNSRSSRNVCEIVIKILNTMGDEAKRVIVNNKEHLFIAATAQTGTNRGGNHLIKNDAVGVSKLFSLPASVDGKFCFITLLLFV